MFTEHEGKAESPSILQWCLIEKVEWKGSEFSQINLKRDEKKEARRERKRI